MSDIRIEINDNVYELEQSFIFSGGELQIRLPENLPYIRDIDSIGITAKLTSSNAIMELMLVHNALDILYPNNDFYLTVNYFPYGRQDRDCYPGEAFSLEVMANIINQMGFCAVFTTDTHSQITNDLLYNIIEASQYGCVIECINNFDIDIENVTLVSPDKGALLKIKALAECYDKIPFNAYKVRDPDTGRIVETKIDVDDFEGKDIFIVDDICDGGRTFIELAKVLKSKNCGKISLYVTHGIFSKGLQPLFDSGIEQIYTTDSFYTGQEDDSVHVLKLT